MRCIRASVTCILEEVNFKIWVYIEGSKILGKLVSHLLNSGCRNKDVDLYCFEKHVHAHYLEIST
jgi:hypothetical protein